MTKREVCESRRTIAYYSGLNGLEIKHIEYGIDDYVYFVAGAWGGGRSYHKAKIHYGGDDDWFLACGKRIHLSECLRV